MLNFFLDICYFKSLPSQELLLAIQSRGLADQAIVAGAVSPVSHDFSRRCAVRALAGADVVARQPVDDDVSVGSTVLDRTRAFLFSDAFVGVKDQLQLALQQVP